MQFNFILKKQYQLIPYEENSFLHLHFDRVDHGNTLWILGRTEG